MFGLLKSKSEKIAFAMIDVAFWGSVSPEEFAAVRHAGIDEQIYKVEVNALQVYITLQGFLMWSRGSPDKNIEKEIVERFYALVNEHCRKSSPIPEQYYRLLLARISEYSEAKKFDDMAPNGAISMEFRRVFVANLALPNGDIPFEFMDTVPSRSEFIMKKLLAHLEKL